METKRTNTEAAVEIQLDGRVNENAFVENANENQKTSKSGMVASAAAGLAAGAAIGATAAAVVNGDLDLDFGRETVAAAPATEGAVDNDVHDAIAGLAGDEPYVEPQPIEMPAPEPVAVEPAVVETPTIAAPTVDPNVVAEDVLAAEMIDPTDINAAEAQLTVNDINDVSYVYTVDGERLTTLAVQDANGEDMYMVDIDGDMIFDAIADANLQPIDIVAGGASLSDIELMQQQGQVGYMAQTDADAEMMNDDSFEADIIDPSTLA